MIINILTAVALFCFLFNLAAYFNFVIQRDMKSALAASMEGAIWFVALCICLK